MIRIVKVSDTYFGRYSITECSKAYILNLKYIRSITFGLYHDKIWDKWAIKIYNRLFEDFDFGQFLINELKNYNFSFNFTKIIKKNNKNWMGPRDYSYCNDNENNIN